MTQFCEGVRLSGAWDDVKVTWRCVRKIGGISRKNQRPPYAEFGLRAVRQTPSFSRARVPREGLQYYTVGGRAARASWKYAEFGLRAVRRIASRGVVGFCAKFAKFRLTSPGETRRFRLTQHSREAVVLTGSGSHRGFQMCSCKCAFYPPLLVLINLC